VAGGALERTVLLGGRVVASTSQNLHPDADTNAA
jgi:hypothetical protein